MSSSHTPAHLPSPPYTIITLPTTPAVFLPLKTKTKMSSGCSCSVLVYCYPRKVNPILKLTVTVTLIPPNPEPTSNSTSSALSCYAMSRYLVMQRTLVRHPPYWLTPPLQYTSFTPSSLSIISLMGLDLMKWNAAGECLQPLLSPRSPQEDHDQDEVDDFCVIQKPRWLDLAISICRCFILQLFLSVLIIILLLLIIIIIIIIIITIITTLSIP